MATQANAETGAAAVGCHSNQAIDNAAHNASASVAERTAGKTSATVAKRAARATACLATSGASSPTVFTSFVVNSVSDAAVEGTAGDPALEASTTAVKRAATTACAAHLWGDDVADQSVFSAVSTVLTTPTLLRRLTRLRSAWLWLLSELRRPSCNALMLGPPLDMCASSTHGPDPLVSTADVRVAELAFALAFMCIVLAASAVGFRLSRMLGDARATSAGGHASQGRGATSSAIIPVKALRFTFCHPIFGCDDSALIHSLHGGVYVAARASCGHDDRP